jgi:hypothetical protein
MFSSFPSALFQKTFSPLFYSNSPSSCKNRSPRDHIKQIPLIELIEYVCPLFIQNTLCKKEAHQGILGILNQFFQLHF